MTAQKILTERIALRYATTLMNAILLSTVNLKTCATSIEPRTQARHQSQALIFVRKTVIYIFALNMHFHYDVAVKSLNKKRLM